MFVKICGSARRCYLDESRAPTERDQEKLRLTQDCCLVRPLAGPGRAEAGGVSQDQLSHQAGPPQSKQFVVFATIEIAEKLLCWNPNTLFYQKPDMELVRSCEPVG